jgi:DNA-binding beta-propeller fold protein YncE
MFFQCATRIFIDGGAFHLLFSDSGDRPWFPLVLAGSTTITTTADLMTVAVASSLSSPSGVTISPLGQDVYLADSGSHIVQRLALASGSVTTLAGASGTSGFADAVAGSARFSAPAGVVVDPTNGLVYVADSGNHRIRLLTLSSGAVTTLAGSATSGISNGAGASAQFSSPLGIAIDSTGKFLFVADTSNHLVRQVALATGAVTTVAGSGAAGFADATGAAAAFNLPSGVAVDRTDSVLYVTDAANNRVRLVVIASGAVSTLAGSGALGFQNGFGVAASFNEPHGVAVDPTGQYLLIAEASNHRVRRIDVTNANVSAVAGSGIGGFADGLNSRSMFSSPRGIAIDASGRFAYVADAGNGRVRMMQPVVMCPGGRYCVNAIVAGFATEGSYMSSGASAASDGVVCPAGSFCYAGASTPAGSGACQAGFFCSAGSANRNGGQIDARGARGGGVLRSCVGVLFSEVGVARRVAPGFLLLLFLLFVLALFSDFFFFDLLSYRLCLCACLLLLRPAAPRSGARVTTLAGSGTSGGDNDIGTAASFSAPLSAAVDANSTNLYVSDSQYSLIRVVQIATGSVRQLAGSGSAAFADGPGAAASFSAPSGLALDANATNLYIADSGNNRVRAMLLATQQVSTVAGGAAAGTANGAGTSAAFAGPQGVAVDVAGVFLYVADTKGHCVRRIALATRDVTTLAGACNIVATPSPSFANGVGAAAAFFSPYAVAVHPTAVPALVFVADRGNHCVRQVNATSGGAVVTTLAGAAGASGFVDAVGAAARFRDPTGVAVDDSGLYVYIVDSGNHRLRRLVLASGLVTTIAGSAGSFANGFGAAALFSAPIGAAVDQAGQNMYVADTGNNRVRTVAMYVAAPCAPGSLCAAGSARATPCPSSFFCPNASQLPPAPPCPGGSSCRAGSSAGQQCPAGYFCPPRVAAAIPAAVGTFANTTGMSAAWPCTPGRFCPDILMRAPAPVGCTAGYYCPARSTSATQMPCEVGSFGNTTGVSAASACAACVNGSFCGATALTAPTGVCAAGTYCSFRATAPTNCPAGTWSAAVGASIVEACAACTTGGIFCPAGSTSAQGGGNCTAGFFCAPGAVSAEAAQCLAGHFCPARSSTAEGAGKCTAGFYCAAGSSSARQAPCLAGFYCPEGTTLQTGAGQCRTKK